MVEFVDQISVYKKQADAAIMENRQMKSFIKSLKTEVDSLSKLNNQHMAYIQ